MQWKRACRISEIGSGKLFRSGRNQIAIFSTQHGVYAVDNRCPHEGYPLLQGSLDPERGFLTCQWHNWKFRLDSGACVLGEDDVRSYPTRTESGDVYVDLTEPPVEKTEERILDGLKRAIRDRQYGRIAREIARFVVSGLDPVIAVRRAIDMTYDRLEFGTTHAYAAAADWLTLFTREEDVEKRVVCLTEAVDHMADDALRHAPYPYAEETRRFDGEAFLDSIEAEDEARAVSFLRGGIRDGLSFDGLEPWLARAAFAHYNDFGHSAIYMEKTRQLLESIGGSYLEKLVLPLSRSIVLATRDDLLPEFRAYGALAADAPEATGRDDSWLSGVAVSGLSTKKTLDWVASRLSTRSAKVLYSALLEAGAVNLMRFDEAHASASPRSPSQNVSWLFFTHALTFANAARSICGRHPMLWPRALLQMACFVGRNKRFVDRGADFAPFLVKDSQAFLRHALEHVYDHGLGQPIFSSHLLKTFVAVEAELPNVSPSCAQHLLGALNRFFSAKMKEKHPLRAARQALALVSS